MKPTVRTMGAVAAIVAVLGATLLGAASSPSAADSGPSATATTTISLGAHNTLHGAASFESFAGVIGWQEVDSPEARDKMRRQLGAEYNHYFPSDIPAKAVPISWRASRFTLVSAGFKLTHGGEAGVTPNRYIVWALLRINETGRVFIVVNTHFISGAWSCCPERQERWLKHYQVLYDKVAAFRANHPGKPVFVVGDFNRHKAMPMPAPVKWVPVNDVSGVPIDQMYAFSTVSHSNVNRLSKRGSDHFAYRMSATF